MDAKLLQGADVQRPPYRVLKLTSVKHILSIGYLLIPKLKKAGVKRRSTQAMMRMSGPQSLLIPAPRPGKKPYHLQQLASPSTTSTPLSAAPPASAAAPSFPPLSPAPDTATLPDVAGTCVAEVAAGSATAPIPIPA